MVMAVVMPMSMPSGARRSTQHLSANKISSMTRLGVQILDESEASLHPLAPSDLPKRVIAVVKLSLHDLFLDELPPWLSKFHQLRYFDL